MINPRDPKRHAYIYEQYVNQKRKVADIANELQLTATYLRMYLRRHEVPLRNDSQAPLITKEQIETEYLINQKTSTEIGNEFGLTKAQVRHYIQKYQCLKRPDEEYRGPFSKILTKEFLLKEYVENQMYSVVCNKVMLYFPLTYVALPFVLDG